MSSSIEPNSKRSLNVQEPGEPQRPLYDPFLFPQEKPEPPRVPLSALLSFPAAFLGPIGSVAGFFLAWFSAREIARKPEQFTGRRWAFLGMAFSAVLLLGWAGAIFVMVPRFRSNALLNTAPPRPGSSEEPVAAAAPSESETPPPPPPMLSQPSPPQAAVPPEPDTGTVPRDTVETQAGAVTVVDVGVSETSLTAALLNQQKKAEARGQTLLVMTVNANCDPCDGVSGALPDPRMQTALARVRLVRVNIDVFRDELDKLRIQHDRWPGFFLLGPDLSPQDAIDGGEWDDDIAANIAPVLNPFVRGVYVNRREKFRPLPPTGVAL